MSDFPTKANPKLCRNGCGVKIYLSKEGGNKYLPYNVDGSRHECNVQEQEPSADELSGRKNNNNKELNDEAKLARAVLLIQDAIELLRSLKKE